MIVKASDSIEVVEAIDRLTAAGIPVVTYATDVPGSSRAGYIGIDNRAAGATAAHLADQWLGNASSIVLITLSSNAFRGEEKREMGFRAALRSFGTGHAGRRPSACRMPLQARARSAASPPLRHPSGWSPRTTSRDGVDRRLARA